MTGILEIKNFYLRVNAAVLEHALKICQSIIMSGAIEEKISIGLSLGPLLEITNCAKQRLSEIASDHIVADELQPLSECPQFDFFGIAHEAYRLQQEICHDVLLRPDFYAICSILQNVCVDNFAVLGSGNDVLPKRPVRDSRLQRSQTKPFQFRSGENIIEDDLNYLGFLFYVLVDVEISAMEICSYMAIEYRAMPEDFTFDMYRQIWDEARHAAYIFKQYNKLGGVIGDFPYTNAVIERYCAASDLLDGLIVQQLLQEANAVENNINLAKQLNAAGRHGEALAFYVINNDEALHAKIGFRWIDYIAQKNSWPSDYIFAKTLRMCRKVGLPLFGMGAWSDTIRESIGTPIWLMHKKWYFGESLGAQPSSNKDILYR